MNVLYIIDGSKYLYGGQKIAYETIKGVKRKHNVGLYVVHGSNGELLNMCREEGIESCEIAMHPYFYNKVANPIIDYAKRNIRRFQADALTKRNIKLLESKVDMKSIDLIHSNRTRDILGALLGQKYSIPHVWSLHELYDAHFQHEYLMRDYTEWMNEHSAGYLAVSETVKKDWISHGLQEGKIKTVFNGIDYNRIKPRGERESREDDKIRIIMSGRICEQKGQVRLIEALANMPKQARDHFRVDFYGNVPNGILDYVNHLHKMIEESEMLDIFQFMGFRNDVVENLNQYDIGVNCSKGESFGLSTVEFMAAGLCVIAANTGANEEIITDGKDGLIFDYKNAAEGIKQKLQIVLQDRGIIDRVGDRARIEAKKYSLDNMIEGVYGVYDEIVRHGMV